MRHSTMPTMVPSQLLSPTSIRLISIAASVQHPGRISWHEVSDPGNAAVGRGSNRQYGFAGGLHGVADLAAYVAGKAGIIALTKVAALDYADQAIRVNV